MATLSTSGRIAGLGLSDDRPGIQDLIDQLQDLGGGELRLEPQVRHEITGAERLPRTDANGNRQVHVAGQHKRRTKLNGVGAFTGTAVINWKDATGATPAAGYWSAWYQSIKNLSISMPFGVAAAAIRFDEAAGAPNVGFRDFSRPIEEWDEFGNPPVTTVPDPRWSKWQGEISDVVIEGTNRDHDAAIVLMGNVWNSTFKDIHLDPAIYVANYDTTLLKVGDGIAAAIDHQGLHCCQVINLSAGMRRGGWATLFSGRAVSTKFINLNAAVGSVSRPYLRLKNSYKCTVDGLNTEGSGAQPQVLLENCREIEMRSITLGKPTDRGAGVGDGISFVATEDSIVHDLGAYPNSPAWSLQGVKRIRLDSRSKRNRITVSLSGVDTPENAIVDEGEHNTIYAHNVTDGRRWTMVNQVLTELD